ncbi:MAG TPA: lactate utilization protein [Candidatus Moranbacteria bacterium]|nr:lactate utilization protein [Candidatus Moranbacteria bacterium]
MDNFLSQGAKRSIKEVAHKYGVKRRKALARLGLSKDDYREKMSKKRAGTFVDFENNLEVAKRNLKAHGFQVFEALDEQMASSKIEEFLVDCNNLVKSKTNTGQEINLEDILASKGKKLHSTDLGDFVVDLLKAEDQHYVLPALHLDSTEIAKRIKEYYGEEVESDPEAITRYLSRKIREEILQADAGITGANFFTKTGEVILLENEGNISLITRLPRKHLIICGIDKLVESVQDATELCQAAAIFGTGQDQPQYISVIAGPSKTADIENQLVQGAQGAQEVMIILLDNGRRKMMKEGFEKMNQCISCGACLNFCPVYHQMGKKFGGKFAGSKGIVMAAKLGEASLVKARAGGSFNCTLCETCSFNCPMKIPLDGYVRKIREQQEIEELQTEQNIKMIDKTKSTGNPFGQKDSDETPDQLHCC